MVVLQCLHCMQCIIAPSHILCHCLVLLLNWGLWYSGSGRHVAKLST